MKRILFSIIFIIGFSCAAMAQGFIEHKVKSGESINTIVQQYQVSPYELYELNPDAKEGIEEGTVLVFLRNKSYPYDPTLVDLKRYRVKKKEKLDVIAKNTGVEVAVIKKYNPKLYAEEISKGDVIRIPVFDKSLLEQSVAVVEKVSYSTSVIEHIVKTKETKYGIAHKYQVTIQELENQNPHIKEGLKVGQLLKIVSTQTEDIEATTATKVNDAFGYYQVQPKDGFFRLSKKLGISKDSLIALNPQLTEGIKLGMILKYPKSNMLTLSGRPTYSLIDSLSNFKRRNITLMLPFQLNKIQVTDTSSNINKLLTRSDVSALNRSLDFYSGVLMAIDSAKQLGISTKLTIIDTEFNSRDKIANSNRIKAVLTRSFEENEVVIGPLVSSNAILVAKELESENVPVLAPLPIKGNVSSLNLYETTASTSYQREEMIKFIEQYSKDKPIVIVADNDVKAIKEELIARFPNAKVITPREEGDLLIPKDFNGVLDPEKENVVIVEASRVSAVATVSSILDSMAKDHKISLFTTSSKSKFDDKAIANRYKAKLNFHFPSVSKEMAFKADDAFVKKFKENYGKLPNKFALRGFDLTLDVLLRQGIYERFEDAVLNIGETSYLESKFNYNRKAQGGYSNSSIYILRYTPELTLEEVSVSNIEKPQEN